MPTLSSLLVQRGFATVRVVEDAIARQVFQGGDLPTNLLEIGGVPEDGLVAALAEVHGLEPAPSGVLLPPSSEVLRCLPAELAARHGVFPLELKDRVLILAVAKPLAPDVEDDLGFALDLAIRQRIATEVRIRQAIAGCYGIPLERRLLRLQARIDGGVDPSPSAIPPPDRDLLSVRMPEVLSIPATRFASGLPDGHLGPARLLEKPAPKAPYVEAQQDLVNPTIPRSPSVPNAIAIAEETPPSGPVSEIAGGPLTAPVNTRPWAPRSDEPEAPAAVPEAFAAPAPVVVDTLRYLEEQEPPGESVEAAADAKGTDASAAPHDLAKLRGAARALAGVIRDAVREEQAIDKRRTAPWRSGERRRKGPFTSGRAEEELAAATSSDEVLEVVFAFAHQFFEYAALFVVHGDVAEGHDAAGPGADRATVTGLGVALDLPSQLAVARARLAPVVARLRPETLDPQIARDLGRAREAGVIRAIAAIPLVVRGRCVALIWGDDGDLDVELEAIGDVVAIAGLAGATLERLALRKKLGPAAKERIARGPVHEGTLALLKNLTEVVVPRPPSPPSPPSPPLLAPPKAAPAEALPANRIDIVGPARSSVAPAAEGSRHSDPRRETAAPRARWSADPRELVQRVIDGGALGKAAFDELTRAPDQAAGAVMARFPGPAIVDRHRARGELPPASQCGPVLELAVAITRSALPFLSGKLSATDPEVRFWAAHAIGELRFPEAATVLVPRLFDDDASVRRIARRSAAALVASGSAGAPILKGLEDIARNPDESRVHRVVAIETMGEIRSGSIVPPLLDALADASDDIAEAARRALLLVTRQDFGRDAPRWHTWWDKHRTKHRVEWLIDALMHDQPQIRRAAGDELKLTTKEYFGYYDDLPRRDRERAQGLYRAWWDQEGRRRFAVSG